MKEFPLIKFTLLFISGITAAAFIHVDEVYLFITAGILLISSFLLYKLTSKNFSASISVFLLAFISAAIIYCVQSEDAPLLPQNLYKQKNFTAYGRIVEINLKREREISFLLKTDSVRINNNSFAGNFLLLTKIKNDSKKRIDSIYNSLLPGNIILASGTYVKGRERRNPGEFDYNKYLNEQGISGTLNVYFASDLKILKKDISFFETVLFKCRNYLDEQITKLHEPQTAALLKGLILADRSGIDYETKTNFVNSGVIHVLAVSGLHVGYIALIFLFLFGRANPYLRSVLIIIGLIIFMFITGVPPSVFRAVVMALVIIIGFLTNRTTKIFNSLAFAALVILLFNPNELFSPGFQLSFSAVWSIAAIYPLVQKEIAELKIKSEQLKIVLLFSGVSLSAQIGTLPFTLAYFGKLSVAALAANLIVIPLIGLILGTAFFTLALNVFSFSLAASAALVNDFLSYLLFEIVNFAGSSSFAFIPVRNFSLIDSIIFYLFLIVGLLFYSKIKFIGARLIFIILIFLNIFFLCSLDDNELLIENEFNLMMIDVGQGDAILLKFPDSRTALIDAGEASSFFDNGERVILPLLNYLGIDKIDYGFISHMDADHYSGFVSLVHNGIIKKIIKPPLDTSLTKDVKFESFVRKMNVPIEYYKKGTINIGGVQIYTLNDVENPVYNSLSTNDKSGLLKIVYGRTGFLFTGDIEKKAEDFYSAVYKDFLSSDVLKVGHHGSTTSSTPGMINYVKPKISLISAGIQNKFNHPSDIILNRLNAAGSKIFRTDKQGAVLYRSNGDSIYSVDWRSY